MNKKWEHEKSERRAERLKHVEEYEERLMTEIFCQTEGGEMSGGEGEGETEKD
jgi:hypothetical protein